MTVTAILTAGGVGSRMQKDVPKQFITVNDIPIIIYTLQQFQKSEYIDKIVIACLKEWQPILRAYSKEFNISKLQTIVEGGETGIDSIHNAFNGLSDDSDNDNDIVIIHDGNRPLVDEQIIKNNVETVKKYNCATTTYIDIHDGVVRVDSNLNIQKSDLRREDIKSTQTPHGFNYKNLKEIFGKITDSSWYISLADAALNLGYDVKLVKGSELNFKITTPNDLTLFESIVNIRQGNV